VFSTSLTMNCCTGCSRLTNLPAFRYISKSSPTLTLCPYCNAPISSYIETPPFIVITDFALHRRPAIREVIFNWQVDRVSFWRKLLGGVGIPYFYLLCWGRGVNTCGLQDVVGGVAGHILMGLIVSVVSFVLLIFFFGDGNKLYNINLHVDRIMKAVSLPYAVNLPMIFVRMWERTDVITITSNCFILSLVLVGVFVVAENWGINSGLIGGGERHAVTGNGKSGLLVTISVVSCLAGVLGRSLAEEIFIGGDRECARLWLRGKCL